MKNLHLRQPDDLANQLESEEKQCTICVDWLPITLLAEDIQRICWHDPPKQWPKHGTCRFRKVKKSDIPIKYEGE